MVTSQTNGTPRRRIRGWILAVSLVGALTGVPLVVRAFLVEAFKIPSPAMFPTLAVGDHIFVKKFSYGWFRHGIPERGDVVVFRYPERQEQDFIKRVVGLPGDTLAVKSGDLFLNGWKVPSCTAGEVSLSARDETDDGTVVVEFLDGHAYLTYRAQHRELPDEQGPWTVAPGEVFVFGDSRDRTYDSRRWFGGRGGGVPLSLIKGRAWKVWMSLAGRGAVAWNRVGVRLDGDPACPVDDAALCDGIRRCLTHRPPHAATVPPGPR